MPLIRHRIIQGEPICVGPKQVVPEAEVTWWVRRRATVGMDNVSGAGLGVVSIRPRAVIERDLAGTRRIPIRDETARMLAGLGAGAVFILFLAEVAVRLATNRGGVRHDTCEEDYTQAGASRAGPSARTRASRASPNAGTGAQGPR